MKDQDNTQASPPATSGAELPAVAADERTGIVAAISGMVTRIFTRLELFGTFTATPSSKKTANDLAEDRTRLSSYRTLMAADRSLMAWVRTALSMISFGFTIYKILQGFEQSGTDLGEAAQPRVVGLFLIGLGTISMVMGTSEYWHRAKELSAYTSIPIWRPSFIMAVLIMLLSIFLFVAVAFRLL